MSDYCPADVMSQVFHKLDLKTLGKCATVCKAWNSIITSRDFVLDYFNRAVGSGNNTTNQPLLLWLCHGRYKKPYDVSFKRHVDCREFNCSLRLDNEKMDLIRMLEYPPIDRFKNQNACFQVIGTCNGLVCLTDDLCSSYTFILWNPTVRKYVLLPRPSDKLQCSVGIGSDFRTNDFKLVRIIAAGRNLAGVFSLSNGSWKTITGTGPSFFINEGSPHMFMNGALHWAAMHKNDLSYFILSFDLAEETFGELLLPESMNPGISADQVSVLGGGESLALVQKDKNRPSVFSIWLMKEYGIVESWTKVFTFDPRQLIIPWKILAFRKSGEVLLEMGGEELYSLNPNTASMKVLGVRGPYVFAGSYMESLLLLEKEKGIISY